MAQQVINLGTNPNDRTGELLRSGGGMINSNFTELYALQSDTINAGAIEYAAATSHGRIQLAIDDAVLRGKSTVFVPAQYLPYDTSQVTFNNSVRMIREGGDSSVYDILAYGATGDGIADDALAFIRALKSMATSGRGRVFLPAGSYLLGSDPFNAINTSAPCRIEGAGMQVTILKKGFNGTWFSVPTNFGDHVRWENITFDGQDGIYTGTGFNYAGLAGGTGNAYHSFFRCQFFAITGPHFSIGVDAAQHLSFSDCESYPSATQQAAGEYVFFSLTGTDTGARHRRFSNSAFLLGVVAIDGAADTYISNVVVKRLETSSTTSQYYIAASLLGNSISTEPVSGTGAIVGCRFAGDVVLDSSFVGSFVGNYQTAGTFTNNTVGSNALVVHHALGVSYHYMGGRAAMRTPSGDEVIATSRNFGFPDADTTLTAGGSAPVIIFNNALAANRTITLSTTGAKNGDRFRIVRKGLGAFTMDVGGLKTIPSATAAFVDVEYTGSAWTLTGYGTL